MPIQEDFERYKQHLRLFKLESILDFKKGMCTREEEFDEDIDIGGNKK